MTLRPTNFRLESELLDGLLEWEGVLGSPFRSRFGARFERGWIDRASPGSRRRASGLQPASAPSGVEQRRTAADAPTCIVARSPLAASLGGHDA